MLVKDFNDSGPLAVRNTFLSNADTPSIACDAIGGCAGIIPDATKCPIDDRSLVITYGPWHILKNAPDKFTVDKQFEVRKNIFEPDNWKLLH